MTSSHSTEGLVDRKHLCKWLSCYTNSSVIFCKTFSNWRKSVGQLSARANIFNYPAGRIGSILFRFPVTV